MNVSGVAGGGEQPPPGAEVGRLSLGPEGFHHPGLGGASLCAWTLTRSQLKTEKQVESNRILTLKPNDVPVCVPSVMSVGSSPGLEVFDMV